MRKSLDEIFIQTYQPLLEKFILDLKEVNTKSLPIPFLPYYGTGYENSFYKIAFVGMETRDSTGLQEYLHEQEKQSEEVFYWFREDLDEPFYFMDKGYTYMNNSGLDFWGFILKFLAKFYGIDDWKELKNKTHFNHAEILKSFIWGNVSSIERYEVGDRGDAKKEDYNAVKLASKIFDQFNILLNVFKPNIVILLNWDAPEEWLLTGISKYSGPLKIEEKSLWYYYFQDTDTHLYWTHHPRSLAFKIDFNDFIYKIRQDIVNRNVFKGFPGKELLEKYNERFVLFETLKNQLRVAANKMSINTMDEDWGNGHESYFYFYLPKSKHGTSICFGFEKGFRDFSVGVDVHNKGNNYPKLKEEISFRLSPIIGQDKNFPNWAYLHYYSDDLKNWSNNANIWEGVSNNQTSTRLIKIINCIMIELSKIEL
ncbi:MAG: hypothetical protein IPP81_09270 [Chitinophagaceae bacterium]|nr:hypothetical protein [Chitinophagaceae bacterium]